MGYSAPSIGYPANWNWQHYTYLCSLLAVSVPGMTQSARDTTIWTPTIAVYFIFIRSALQHTFDFPNHEDIFRWDAENYKQDQYHQNWLRCNTSQNDGTKRLHNIFQIYHFNNIRISFPVIGLLDQNVGNAAAAFPRKIVGKWRELVCVYFSLWSLSSLWLEICLLSMVSTIQSYLSYMFSIVNHMFTHYSLYSPIMLAIYGL